MSQQAQVEQLKALLEKNEREKLELIQKLSRAQSQTSFTTPRSDTSHGYRQAPPSGPPLGSNDRSSHGAMPRNATSDLRSHPKQARQDQSRPMKRSKTTHAAGSSTAAPMMRSRSSISRPGPNQNPFANKGPSPLARSMRSSLSAAPPGSLGDYLQQYQSQYTTNISIPDSPLVVETSQHGEFGREMAVHEYLMVHDNDFTTASPINIPPPTLLSPQELDPYPSSSFPSVCGSMTSGPTLETAPMSRCNSSLNDGASISGRFSEMVRVQSQHSTQNYSRQDGFRPHPNVTHLPLLGKRASEDSSVSMMEGDSFAYAYPSSAPTRSALSQHQHPMEISLSQSSIQSTSSAGLPSHNLSGPALAQHNLSNTALAQHLSMERSVSKDSIKSNSSLKVRAKVALARQNHAAAKARHLQPKPAAGAVKQEVPDSVNSSAKDGKAVIAKTKYERPKHPKVMCNQCSDHPEGFRGEHELRRHTEAKHKSMVKKWICRDPDLFGIAHSETAVKSLKDCKQCSANKQYGAYYNAAAHLRRTHFKVKPRKGASGSSSKNGQGKVEEEKEKRGGKGGGDWPSMGELKLWMVEVIVPMDQPGALVPDSTESVGAVDAEDYENEFVDAQYSSEPPAAMGSEGFDMTSFAGVGGGFDQPIDMTGASFSVELDSQLPEMYPIGGQVFPVATLQGLPISSAGFDYRNPDLNVQQGIPASLMSLDSHGYTSPVSSTATITQTGVYMDQILPLGTAMHALSDDIADLPFDLTFTNVGQ